MTRTRIVIDPTDNSRHVVADEIAPGEERFFGLAPEPYHVIAKYWLFDITSGSQPWNKYALRDAEVEDELLTQFVRVQGAFPQRRDWVARGGRNRDYFPARGQWQQDSKLFKGIIENPPTAIAAELADAQPVFDEYAMGRPIVFRMVRVDELGERLMYCLAFPETTVPPSRDAIFHWRAEDIEDGLGGAQVAQIVSDYQEELIRAAIHVPKLHPQVSTRLAAMNAALKAA